MKRGALLAAALTAACVQPPIVPAPAPMNLTTPLPPTQVVQRAAQRLTIEGFTVITSDATGGILTAVLTRQGGGDWGPLLTCRLAPNSVGRASATETLTARIVAQASGPGSAVYISATAVTDYGRSIFSDRNGNTEDCVSSGLTEKAVADAIAAP